MMDNFFRKILKTLFFIALSHSAMGQGIVFEKFLLNGVIRSNFKRSELESNGIKTDSVTRIPELMDGSDADSLIYIGETYFKYYSQSDICFSAVVKFDDKIRFIDYDGVRLSESITLDSIAKIFPKSCSEINELSVYGDPKTYKVCGVPVVDSEGELTDMSIIFFFYLGKLRRIDFWEPL